MSVDRHVLALCGGVGGAKLALGLERILGGNLTVIVNTGDDFQHLGLFISPDIDTVLYTLGGVSDVERGWGRANESWSFMEALHQLGGETWFRLGDRDLAMHVARTQALRQGESPTAFTDRMAKQFGIAARILPMTDDPIGTIVVTPDGPLPFQRYFVGLQCAPTVTRIVFEGAESARPTSQVLQALHDPELAAVLVCPSNPYLSIDPILSLPGIREALERVTAPVIAVSPIIGGQAVKGPTAKIMAELGKSRESASIVQHYGFLDGLVLDHADADEAPLLGVPAHVASTWMRSLEDRERLALECLAFADELSRG
jgi:LPPG:FO 2-phospho-L-lactate transferase